MVLILFFYALGLFLGVFSQKRISLHMDESGFVHDAASSNSLFNFTCY